MHRTERKLAYIAAGGTIDKIYGTVKGTVNYSFRKQPAIVQIIHRMGYTGNLKLFRLEPMDSTDMGPDDHSAVANESAANEAEAIVVTHGTDTMTETASYIAARTLDKTIVLTGSSLPASDRDSDADGNVAFATALALVLPHGVYIAMHGRYYLWNECEKTPDGRFIRRKHH